MPQSLLKPPTPSLPLRHFTADRKQIETITIYVIRDTKPPTRRSTRSLPQPQPTPSTPSTTSTLAHSASRAKTFSRVQSRSTLSHPTQSIDLDAVAVPAPALQSSTARSILVPSTCSTLLQSRTPLRELRTSANGTTYITEERRPPPNIRSSSTTSPSNPPKPCHLLTHTTIIPKIEVRPQPSTRHRARSQQVVVLTASLRHRSHRRKTLVQDRDDGDGNKRGQNSQSYERWLAAAVADPDYFTRDLRSRSCFCGNL